MTATFKAAPTASGLIAGLDVTMTPDADQSGCAGLDVLERHDSRRQACCRRSAVNRKLC